MNVIVDTSVNISQKEFEKLLASFIDMILPSDPMGAVLSSDKENDTSI